MRAWRLACLAVGLAFIAAGVEEYLAGWAPSAALLCLTGAVIAVSGMLAGRQ